MNCSAKLSQLNLIEPIAVIGMGISGQAALKLLQAANLEVAAFDEKDVPNAEKIDLSDENALNNYRTLVLSPGVDSRKKAIAASSAEKINDVEIFARLNEKKIAAVTGSNGKSTTVSMLTEILNKQNKNAVLCGNIGRSVLEAFCNAPEDTEIFVLELSNYQLERCPSLKPDVAAVLNVTPDHLDRYDSFEDYAATKSNMAKQAKVCVLNTDDDFCRDFVGLCNTAVKFGSQENNCVADENILIDGKKILACNELSVEGMPNYQNALAVLLMSRVLEADLSQAAKDLCEFQGLAHRVSKVIEHNGIAWIDDSKATNIGAAAAALSGISAPIWLIAGGVGKDQDFSLLAEKIKTSTVKKVLLIGLNNQDLEQALNAAEIEYKNCVEMSDAIAYAYKNAASGDCVLLSPATASFDQFSGYAERGNCFAAGVKAICK
ncbi:MAG: UDP-N-acetylmuramoyl-L-alanine--D-glutamate ligase [Cardiobacteriaceae bacterium]|nr:UDP-N-acetylmuramoyl-L-alanine--D-glutamate ligase [Cardiobacteriaceae bacterium]